MKKENVFEVLKSKVAKRNALYEFTLLNKDFCGCKIQNQVLQIKHGFVLPISVVLPK